MRFPKLRVTEQTREFIQEFGGLDRRPRIPENCFSDMRNLTSDQYPALAPREKRGVVGKIENCNALIARDKLAYVKGNTLYYGEGKDEAKMELTAGEDVPRQLVSMGAYIVVFPDHMYLNTTDTEDQGVFRTTIDSKDVGAFSFSTYQHEEGSPLVKPEGRYFPLSYVGSVRLLCADHGFRSINYSPSVYYCSSVGGVKQLKGIPKPNDTCFQVEIEEKGVLEVVDTASNNDLNVKWLGGPLMEVTIWVKNEEIGLSLEHTVKCGEKYEGESDYSLYNGEMCLVYDPITGSSFKSYLLEGTVVHKSVLRVRSPVFESFPDGEWKNVVFTSDFGKSEGIPYLRGISNEAKNAYKQGDSLWFEGAMNGALTYTLTGNYTAKIEVDSIVPHMDYVIESQNRLWGCRYGEGNNGEMVNEIYASALGSFSDWYAYLTRSTDSYAASVGMDGHFTGAINYRGYPLFFKENVMYKIYGDYPENYQIVSDTSMGVQEGCDKSLCVLSNMLYYKSPDGIFAYDGSSVARIDAALGREYYRDVVCGGLGAKLWFSMEGEDPAHNGIYVYDTDKGVWHKEDERKVRYFARYNNDLYCIDESNNLFTVRGTDGELEADDVNFFAETGVIGYSTPDSKYVSRLALRLLIPHDGRLNIYIEYDSANVWEFKGCIEGNGLGTFTIPIVPRNCDHFRIRFEGRGACRIFGFSKVMEEGGAV